MTIRFSLTLLALMALAACEDLGDLSGIGPGDPIEYGSSTDVMEL